jgi:hypothetical protein
MSNLLTLPSTHRYYNRQSKPLWQPPGPAEPALSSATTFHRAAVALSLFPSGQSTCCFRSCPPLLHGLSWWLEEVELAGRFSRANLAAGLDVKGER